MGVCLFLGNLYRIEQRGAYGEIKGLRERVKMMRERKRNSLAKTPQRRMRAVGCIGKR